MKKYLSTAFLALILGGLGLYYFYPQLFSNCNQAFVYGQPVFCRVNGQAVIVQLLVSESCVSYNSRSNESKKEYKPSWYIQSVDPSTGEVLQQSKIDCKAMPGKNDIDLIGGSDETVWLYNNGILAYSASSLEPVADADKLYASNPTYRNQLPVRRDDYRMNASQSALLVNAKNGQSIEISNRSLTISNSQVGVAGAREEESSRQYLIAVVDRLHRLALDPSLDTTKAHNEYTILSARRDSLQVRYGNLMHQNQVDKDLLRNRPKAFTEYDALVGAFHIGDTVYGLLSDDELKDRHDYVYFRKPDDKGGRRSLFTAQRLPNDRNDYTSMRIQPWQGLAIGSGFLEGGFMTDRNTGEILLLPNPQSVLILHHSGPTDKDPLLLSKVSLKGSVAWEAQLPITKFKQQLLADHYLLLLSYSAADTRVMQYDKAVVVDLESGAMVQYGAKAR